MIDRFILAAQVVLAFIGLYQLLLALFGYRAPKNQKQYDPQKTFAVLVAAHNEEQVIGALVDNLKNLKYPKELYDIFVIADNCTDQTAGIARSMGVYTYERHHKQLRGKGYAIEWMLKQLWNHPRTYDAVVMFDADNLVSQDFLHHMNNDLCKGSQVIQGYLDTKNPHDSWITSAYAISYWYCNRLWQMPRRNLGMANFLGGTGMCFDAGLLKEMGWGATSLVEDLEFTMRCVRKGIYPTMNYEAKVYDEKPITLLASCKQRLRWMQGHFHVARRYFFPLLWQGLKERSLTKIDSALYAANVYHLFLGSLLTVILWGDQFIFGGAAHFPSIYVIAPLLFNTLNLCIYAQFPIAMMLEKAPISLYRSLIPFFVFLISWWPVTFYAFFTQNNKQWSHTEHTRVIRWEDIRTKQAS